MFRGFSRNISTGDSATNTATTQVELKNGIKTITLNHPKTRYLILVTEDLMEECLIVIL